MLTENAAAFHAANQNAGVVKAKSNPDGGGTYTLEDDSEWTLTEEECKSLGVPVWDSE